MPKKIQVHPTPEWVLNAARVQAKLSGENVNDIIDRFFLAGMKAADTVAVPKMNHPSNVVPSSNGASTMAITDNRSSQEHRSSVINKPVNDDVIQIYYPKSKKSRLRNVIAKKGISFQEYFRRLFDEIIAKNEA